LVGAPDIGIVDLPGGAEKCRTRAFS
jgi:hypothetical protein